MACNDPAKRSSSWRSRRCDPRVFAMSSPWTPQMDNTTDNPDPPANLHVSEDSDPHVSPDRTSSLRRALAFARLARDREIDASARERCWASSCQLENVSRPRALREFLEDLTKELRRTGYAIECRARSPSPAEPSSLLFYSSGWCACVSPGRPVYVCVGVGERIHARKLDEISRRGHHREFCSGSDTANGHCAGER